MRFLGIILVFLFVLTGPVLAQDDTDRGYLAGLLEDQLGGPGRTVRIEGFAGAFSSTATIEKITISDASGIWLEIDEATIEWTRAALLRGAIDVQNMTAKRIALNRAPQPVDASLPAAEAQGFSLPELPVSIDLQKLSVAKVVLGESLLGERAELRFDGSATLQNGDGNATFAFKRTDNKIGQFTGEASYDSTSENLGLNIALIEGKGGIFARFAGLPRDPSVRATIKGQGPLSDFRTDLILATDGQERLTGAVTLMQSDPAQGRRFQADIQGDIAALFLPQYRAFFGNEIALKVSGEQGADGALTLRDMALATDALSLRGDVSLTPAFWPAFVDIEGRIAQQSGDPILLPLTGPEVRIGRADLLVKYDAGAGDTWGVTAQVSDLRRSDVGIDRLSLTGRGVLDPAQDRAAIGSVSGDFTFKSQGMDFAAQDLQQAIGDAVSGSLSAQFAKNQPLELRDLALQGADYGVVGSARVQGVDAAFATDFELAVTAARLARFAPLIGQSLRGQAELKVAGQADAGGGFAVDLSGQTNQLQIGQAQADKLLAGRGEISARLERSSAGLLLRDVRVQTNEITAVADARLASETSDARFDVRLRNAALIAPGAPGPLSLAGTAQAVGQVWSVDVAGSGPFGASASVQGTVSGSAPALDVAARLPNIGTLVDGFSGPATLAGSVVQQANGWQVQADIQGPAGANARVGGQVSNQARANLTVDGALPLGLLNPFVAPRRIQGNAALDLRLSGPLAVSSMAGRVGLSDVRVSAPTFNTALTDGAGQIALANGRADVQFRSNVSSGGQIAAQGSIGTNQGFPVDLVIDLDNVGVTDPALYRTWVSGQLALRGPLQSAPRLSGQLNLGETRIKVPSTGFGGFSIIPEIAHIAPSKEVVATQRRANTDVQAPDTNAAGSAGASIGLDVTVSAPSRIFVRGRGLDAELGGTVQLSGTTNNIVSAGRFELVRGRIDLLTKRFDLDEGSIQLTGDLDPFIRFVATTPTDTGSASIVVSGRVSAPEVTFESSPQAPEDEVLAQIFFGRSAAQLSAFQALELANAVRQLQGRGGEGVVSKLRRKFGLDDLEIRVDDEGNAGFRAGKYISDNVYTDIEVGQTTDVTINVDITPNLTARGTLGSDGDTALGIFFEKDY